MSMRMMKAMKRSIALMAVLLGPVVLHPIEAIADPTCVQNGGTVICTQPTYRGAPAYSICDDQPPAIYRVRGWCEVLGGTWDGDHSTCIGNLDAVSPSNAASVGQAFEDWIHGPSCGGGPPPGACTDIWCSCHTSTSYGIETQSYSVMPYMGKTPTSEGCTAPWAENIVFGTAQQVGCAPGYALTGGDDSFACTKAQICWECLGNPIDIADGSKVQREVDYHSPGPGGLRFERFYNSSGYYSLTQRKIKGTDFWRHTYSSRIIQYSSTYVLAAAQRANGSLIVFKGDGSEFHNNIGAAHHLVREANGSWTLTTPENDVERYDTTGLLTSITTRSGFVTTLSYGSTFVIVSDSFGRVMTLNLDDKGRVATMVDPSSRTYTYAYADSDKYPIGPLAMVTYPEGETRRYVYESPNHEMGLTGIIDERGVRISTYAYDSIGRANYTEKTGPDNKVSLAFTDTSTTATTYANDGYGTNHAYGFLKVNGALKKTSHQWSDLGTENWTYDLNGNPQTYTDRNGNQTSYTYDGSRNLELSRTEAYGTSVARTITTTWHTTFRFPATITEPSGVAGVNLVTTYTYDTAGNLTKKNMTAGTKSREWNYTVNSRGQVLTIDGPRTDATDISTITYYADNDSCVGCRGQVYTVTNAAGHVTTFNSYDLDGRPTQVTDPNGVGTTLTYKSRGWLESRTASGETTTYGYDPAGNLISVTLPDGSYVSYEYDVAGGLVGVGDTLGNSIDYDLDVMGYRVQENVFYPSNTLAKTMNRVYDSAQRMDRELGAASQTTIYTYDANRNVRTITDPLSRVTTNNYDALDRLTSTLDAAGGTTIFTYDAKDRLATVKDPQISATTSYTYDGLGNLTQQASPDTGTTTFTYDNAGNVATQADARSVTTTYTYDTLNRVTAATVTDGAVTYEYDNTATGGAYAKGRLTKITDPSGNTTYGYDSLGRVTSKTQTTNATPANRAFTVGYGYSLGRQSGITYPSGRAVAYSFDAKGQVAGITVDGTTILSSAAYFPFGAVKSWTWGNGQAFARTFDTDGRISAVTVGPNAGSYADLSQVFTYDNLDRLKTASGVAGQSQVYTYDANSNRTSLSINSAVTTYNYPGASHKLSSLSGATTRSFTYDNAGNVTASAGITYAYDDRGRMKSAGAATYLVNGLGQRVKKTVTGDAFFAYDEAGHLIGEYDSAGAPIQETVWLGDTPVAVIKAKTGGFDVFYIWTDNLGTPRLITDTANVSRWEWPIADPFGNSAPSENPAGAGAFNFNLRFPGQYFDAETGKHYNFTRDYDPALGRFLQSDLIGLGGGPNTYSYVGANPMAWVDPLGESLRKWVGLSDGWMGGVDVFTREGGAAYHEIHVIDPQGKEVGVVTEKGWVGKHGKPAVRPANVPDKVCNAINGVNIHYMRQMQKIKERGRQNIKGFRKSIFGVGLIFTLGPAFTESTSDRELLENILAGLVGAGDAGERDWP